MNKYEKYHNKVLSDFQAGKKISRKQAVRAFCLSCVGFSSKDVIDCRGDDNCPLFAFRLGAQTTLQSRRPPKKAS